MNNLYDIYILNNIITDVKDLKLNMFLNMCKTSKTIVN